MLNCQHQLTSLFDGAKAKTVWVIMVKELALSGFSLCCFLGLQQTQLWHFHTARWTRKLKQIHLKTMVTLNCSADGIQAGDMRENRRNIVQVRRQPRVVMVNEFRWTEDCSGTEYTQDRQKDGRWRIFCHGGQMKTVDYIMQHRILLSTWIFDDSQEHRPHWNKVNELTNWMNGFQHKQIILCWTAWRGTPAQQVEYSKQDK